MKKYFIISLLLFVSIVWFVINIYPRYYFLNGSQNGTDFAQEIIKNKRDVSDCFKIIAVPLLSWTTSGEQSALCIHTYASLTKDPSACALLMPSSYGLSCVGEAMEENLCSFVNKEVWWEENGNKKKISRSECVNNNVSESFEEKACCIISKIASLQSENDCTVLRENTSFYDECLYRLSFKNHDSKSCERITDSTIKAGCIVSAEALGQDPSIIK